MYLRRSHGCRPALIVMLIAVGALVLSSCDWTQFRFGPEGTGFNPVESTIGTSNVAGLQQRWSETSGVPGTESSPVVANGVVFANSSAGRLDAFDAATGSAKWSFTDNSGWAAPSPAVVSGVVYDIANDGVVYAIDAASGTTRWSKRVDVSGPFTVANGVMYVAGTSLYALNAATGATFFPATLTAPIYGGTPAVANGVVYTTPCCLAYDVLAFNATTGALLRTAVPNLLSPRGPYGAAAVANGVLYVIANDPIDGGTLMALNAKTGALLWSAASGSSSPAVANGVVYAKAPGGTLSAFNATTGAPIWSTPSGGTAIASSPVIANGVVYAGDSNGKLDAFDAKTGTVLWSSPATGSAVQPVVADGVVYAGSDEGHLYAYGLPVLGAALTVSPTFGPDYGTVLDGTSSPETTFTVTNFGSSATAISDDVAGADPTQFRVTSDTCSGATLTGHASCTIGVRFSPTLPGPRTATLTARAATGSTASAVLSGTGNPFTIDPAGHDYGYVVAGTSTPPTTFTVTNHSVSPLIPTVASLAGTPFTATSDTCSGATLDPRATCRLSLTFTAPNVNIPTPYNANLSVSSTPGPTTTVGLAGFATPIAILPATNNYGTVPVGSGAQATFTIKNVESSTVFAPLYQSSVTGDGFSITSDGCNGITLAGGATCTIVVTFTPSAAGTTYNGDLVVYAAEYGLFEMNHASLIGTGG
jgi:outer membrane protein assembly factor BamB